MSLESRYETLKSEIEAWWGKHVGHPSIGSIASAHLNVEGKPELDKIVENFTAPDVFHVEPTSAPVSFLPPSA